VRAHGCRRFELIVRGSARAGGQAPIGAAGFVRRYVAIATTPEKALEFAQGVDSERFWSRLEVEGVDEPVGVPPDELQGVVEASGIIWYGDDEESNK